MTPFWACILIFAVGLMVAFGYAYALTQLVGFLRINLHCADRLNDAQAKRILQLQQDVQRLRDRLAPFERKHGPGGRFTGKAA